MSNSNSGSSSCQFYVYAQRDSGVWTESWLFKWDRNKQHSGALKEEVYLIGCWVKIPIILLRIREDCIFNALVSSQRAVSAECHFQDLVLMLTEGQCKTLAFSPCEKRSPGSPGKPQSWHFLISSEYRSKYASPQRFLFIIITFITVSFHTTHFIWDCTQRPLCDLWTPHLWSHQAHGDVGALSSSKSSSSHLVKTC